MGYPSPLFLLNFSPGKASVGCRTFARCPIPWPCITSDGWAPQTGSIKIYVSELYASGFRCFGPDSPLTLNLRRGLNVLAGPNDSGKTAVIDAPRQVLRTRGDDFLRLEPGDFHVKPDGDRVTEPLIRCTFDRLTPDAVSKPSFSFDARQSSRRSQPGRSSPVGPRRQTSLLESNP